ncbi:MAG: CoA-binding protein [Proteobacteria bacterium]|nr:CoA-binding protein [Pseudomonadota bacterium]
MDPIIERFAPLFSPRTLAVVGASKDARKWGFTVLRNLISGGFTGKIYPVNPREPEIMGLKVFPSLAAIPGEIDLAIVIVPSPQVLSVLQDCRQRGVKAVFIITSGFGETGDEGKSIEKEIARIAEEGRILLAGPNGQGLVNTKVKMYALMGAITPEVGHISLVSQSGNVGGTLMSRGTQLQVGFQKFISSGNEAFLKTEDYLEYFGADPDTRVILAYVEGIKDGRRFVEVAGRVARKKPVLLLKGGRTRAGNRATASHTGSMSSEDALLTDALKQAGVIQVDGMEDLFDLGVAFIRQPLPRGKRAGILTIGGGWGVLAADAAEREGLDVVPLPPGVIAELDRFLPAWWSRVNPVDTVAGTAGGMLLKSLKVLLACPEIDGLILLGIGHNYPLAKKIKESPFYPDFGLDKIADQMMQDDLATAAEIVSLMDQYQKPVVTSSEAAAYSRVVGNQALQILEREGIITYTTPDKAARVLATLAKRSEFLRKRRSE